MVVTIDPHNQEIIVLIDIERTGVIALSLMSMRFPRGSSPHVIEDAVGKMLDGWVELGGHWSTELEKTLEDICACERVPRVLIPREKFRHSAKMWANRLMDRLGLTSS